MAFTSRFQQALFNLCANSMGEENYQEMDFSWFRLCHFFRLEQRFDDGTVVFFFVPKDVAAEGSMPVAPVEPAVATSLLQVSIFPSKSQSNTIFL